MTSISNRYGVATTFVVALFGVAVQSRAVNISNTWMLPEEGFPVFYRYFRDRISWYEADAVCQFHHANLVTADSSSQYDSIRAYLKELDITEKVWIGLSKPQEKPKFLWTDLKPLSTEGHWQETLPIGDSQSLCAVMDPAADFLWRALPCGGPEVAAFICELPIPSWAQGPRGCLLTELPSLTVLYIPEQSALELTSDCGLDGTKRIACKGNADHEEMIKQLACVISHEDMDESLKTSTSDYLETSSSFDENTISDKSTKSWTSNTINAEYGTSTRHRRETEDTLSPVATKSSFKEVSTSNISWQDTHKEKMILTTEHVSALNDHVTPTPVTTFSEMKHPAESITTVANEERKNGSETAENFKFIAPSITQKPLLTTQTVLSSDSVTKTVEKSTSTPSSSFNLASTNVNPTEISGSQPSSTTQEGNAEDYPSAINQGQLFSIIDNGTMFDIIELNETDQNNNREFAPTSTQSSIPTKKPQTKKPIQPTKKATKIANPKTVTTEVPSTTKHIQTVDELEENLTKEFEMMPDIKDNSEKLNRTFRKELPVHDEHTGLEDGGQFGVPRILNFTITNALEQELQQDQPQEMMNSTDENNISSVVKKNEAKLDDAETTANSLNYKEEVVVKLEPSQEPSTTTAAPPFHNPIDPRLYILNHHANAPKNNESELIHLNHTNTIEQTKIVSKEEFLPRPLLGNANFKHTDAIPTTTPHSLTSDGFSEHPFPSDEPKKVNRHRNLHGNKSRKFYPYFFSRMLG